MIKTPYILFVKSLLVFLFSTGICYGQLNKGWEAFYENKITDARGFFINAVNEQSSRQEALLALSFLAAIDKTDQEAFDYFVKFYDNCPNTKPYLLALWNSNCVFKWYEKKTEAQINFLKKIIKEPVLDGTVRALAQGMLGYQFEFLNNDKASIEAFNKIGSLENWQIVGEFENISGSGFNKKYAPVNSPDSTKIFINKLGASVNWFRLPPNRRDKWIDIQYPLMLKETICFAQTFVQSDDERTIQLRVGTSGSLKIWLNDCEVFAEPKERNNDLDTYIVEVKINKGYNRLLLQIGESELNRLNFLARITNDNGDPIQALKTYNTVKPYTVASTCTSKQVKLFAEDYFEKAIKTHPGDIINYLLLIEAYRRNGKHAESRRIIQAAQKMAPRCSYFYARLKDSYAMDDNETGRNEATNWLKENDPTHLISLNLEFEDQFSKKEYVKAREVLDQMEQLYGINEKTTLKKLRLIVQTKPVSDQVSAIDAAYAKYPDDYSIVQYKHDEELYLKNNNSRAIDILKKYQKAHYSQNIAAQIGQEYERKDEWNKAVKTYQAILEKYPYSTGYMQKIGNYYSQHHDYENAALWHQKALGMAPYSSYSYGALARIYEAQKQNNKAIESYKKSISYYPDAFENRKDLRKLENKKDVFSYFEKPDAVKLFKAAPGIEAYPEDNSLILYQEKQKVVYPDGVSEEKYFLLVKVFNADGIEQWKEQTLDRTSDESLTVETVEAMKLNGNKVKAEINDNQIVFTTLEPGDAIYLVYKVEKRHLVISQKNYFADTYCWTSAIPYLKSKYSLLIAPDIKFRTAFTNDSIVPVKAKNDEFDSYTWEKTNQNSIRYEDKMPSINEISQTIFLSSMPDWGSIINWYADIALPKAEVDDEIKEAVAKIVAGKENMSDLEKARAIFSYIVNNVRYSSVPFMQDGIIPQKASKVLNTKIGDCKDVSILFVAMCRAINLEASLVLVNTEEKAKNGMLLPAINFNHCIAVLQINKDKYYADLTSDIVSFNAFNFYQLNSFALEITHNKDEINQGMNSPTRVKNTYHFNATVDLSNDNTIVVNYTSTRTGMEAALMRYYYKNIGRSEQEKILKKVISIDFSDVKIDTFEMINLFDQNDTVISRVKYTAYNALKKASRFELFSIPWTKASAQDFSFDSERKYPISLEDLLSDGGKTERMTLNIPSGKKIAEAPENVSYSCDIADYSLSFKLSTNKLVAERIFKYKKDVVPLNKINEFKEFYNKVIEADTRDIVLVK